MSGASDASLASGSAAAREGPYTLSIDVGGSGLKAAVLDAAGRPLGERVRVRTPRPCPPRVLVSALLELVRTLPPSDRVSVGFPGVVRGGRVLTAPNLGTEAWRGFDLAADLAHALQRPVRALNDAEVQGLGVIEGAGIETVITLGTGFGFGLFEDGRPAPHLEMAHHPFRKGQTYEQQLGERALEKVGRKKWNRRLLIGVETLRELILFDRLYCGGGNSRLIDFVPPPDVAIVSNAAGILGGIALWRFDARGPPRTHQQRHA